MPKRTTITLDDDVAAKLDEEARRRGKPFRETVNTVLRRGLNPPRRPAGSERFKVEARLLRARPGITFDNINPLV